VAAGYTPLQSQGSAVDMDEPRSKVARSRS
jgi:hypothetical protein